MAWSFIPKDEKFFELFEAQAVHSVAAAKTFREMALKWTRDTAPFDRLRGSRHDEADIPAPGAFGLPGDSSWNFKYSPHYNLSGGLAADAGRFFAASNFNVFGPGRSLRGAIPAQFWADASLGYRNGGARHTLAVKNLTDGVVEIPEYVRLRVVETLPLYTGRRLEYTFSYRF